PGPPPPAPRRRDPPGRGGPRARGVPPPRAPRPAPRLPGPPAPRRAPIPRQPPQPPAPEGECLTRLGDRCPARRRGLEVEGGSSEGGRGRGEHAPRLVAHNATGRSEYRCAPSGPCLAIGCSACQAHAPLGDVLVAGEV